MTLKLRRHSDFRTGRNLIRIAVTGPNGIDQKEVLVTPEAVENGGIQPALDVLNKAIAGWPSAPVTIEQVRALV
jgi:hypothetical protein